MNCDETFQKTTQDLQHLGLLNCTLAAACTDNGINKHIAEQLVAHSLTTSLQTISHWQIAALGKFKENCHSRPDSGFYIQHFTC
jgi:hypothetical protein